MVSLWLPWLPIALLRRADASEQPGR
jgi:hypothetical protein